MQNLNPYFQTKYGKYYLGDSNIILKQIEEKADIVFTDPPYFEHHKHGVGHFSSYKTLLPIIYEKMKENAWLVIYFPSSMLDRLFIETTKYFEYVDRFVVHFQNSMTKGAFGDKHTLELCVFRKGNPKVYERIYTDVLLGVEDPFIVSLHPTSFMWKPTFTTSTVILKLIGETENKVLLDPFAGYGSILIVAEKLKMKWIGIEINKEYAGVAKQILVNNVPIRKAIDDSKKERVQTLESFIIEEKTVGFNEDIVFEFEE